MIDDAPDDRPAAPELGEPLVDVAAAALVYAGWGWELMPRRRDRSGRLVDVLTGSPRCGLIGEGEVAGYLDVHPRTEALAVVTGPKSGVLVLDVDQHEGGADGPTELRRLEAEHGPLPCTPFVLTPSGSGRHLYFAWPGSPIRNGAIAPGLEVLGDRCAATLPPSRKASGAYRWSLSRHPDFLERAEPPGWLVAMMRPPEPKPRPRIGAGDRYTRAALDRECEAVTKAAPGARNNTLLRAAWSLARLDLESRTIEDALTNAAEWARSKKSRATIRRGMRRRSGA